MVVEDQKSEGTQKEDRSKECWLWLGWRRWAEYY